MTNEILSLEEGVRRSLPFYQFRNDVERFVNQNPGYFSPSSIGGNAIPIVRFSGDPLSEKCIIAFVDIKEYLNAYSELIDTPSNIHNYLNMMQSEIKELTCSHAKKNRFTRGSFEEELIRIVFGMTSNPTILLDYDNVMIEEVEGYIKSQILKPLFKPLVRSQNRVMAVLIGDHYDQSGSFEIFISDFWPQRMNIYHNPPLESKCYGSGRVDTINFSDPMGLPHQDKTIGRTRFEGLRRTLTLLTECDAIDAVYFYPGQHNCIIPTYRR